jgi:hypothetical protein
MRIVSPSDLEVGTRYFIELYNNRYWGTLSVKEATVNAFTGRAEDIAWNLTFVNVVKYVRHDENDKAIYIPDPRGNIRRFVNIDDSSPITFKKSTEEERADALRRASVQHYLEGKTDRNDLDTDPMSHSRTFTYKIKQFIGGKKSRKNKNTRKTRKNKSRKTRKNKSRKTRNSKK